MGQITIKVIDNKCDLESEFTVYDFITTDEIGGLFLREHRRSRTAGEDVPPLVRREDSEQWINVNDTLYQAGVQHNDTMVLEMPAFEIRIREHDADVEGKEDAGIHELLVSDDLTVGEVKSLYSEKVWGGIGDNDKFLFGGHELDDNVMIYKYNLRAGSELFVEREDISQPATIFQCGECGNEIKLRKRDAVQCRSCGHRILFKSRSKQISAYLAR